MGKRMSRVARRVGMALAGRTPMQVLGWIVATVCLLGSPASLLAQGTGVDSASAAATESLRPKPDSITPGQESRDSALRRNSQLETALLGFLAGAAAGLVIAHIVNQTRDGGNDKLETYLALPPVLGLFTFATVFIALDD